MFKSLKNNNAGFSIVEIMIVLVVVGLVTTGVILAAQTLNRNARNDARDRDVQLIASGISDYQQANNGSLGGAQNAIAQSGSFVGTLELSHYDGDNDLTDFDSLSTNATANKSYFVQGHTLSSLDFLPDENNVHIWVGYKCPDTVAAINAHVVGDTNKDGDGAGERWTYIHSTSGNDVVAATGKDHADLPTTNFGGWKLDTSGNSLTYGSFAKVTNRAFAIVSQHEGGGDTSYRCVDFGS